MSIPDNIYNGLNRAGEALTNIPKNVKGYAEGRSDVNQANRMRLYPAPPIKPAAGPDGIKQDLGKKEQLINIVYGVTAAPVMAVVHAPYAAFKNSLMKKENAIRTVVHNNNQRMNNEFRKGGDNRPNNTNSIVRPINEVKSSSSNSLPSIPKNANYFDAKMSKADRIESDLNDAKAMKQELEEQLVRHPQSMAILGDLKMVNDEISKLEGRKQNLQQNEKDYINEEFASKSEQIKSPKNSNFFDAKMTENDRIKSDLKDALVMKEELEEKLLLDPKSDALLDDLEMINNEIGRLRERGQLRPRPSTPIDSARHELRKLMDEKRVIDSEINRFNVMDPEQLKEMESKTVQSLNLNNKIGDLLFTIGKAAGTQNNLKLWSEKNTALNQKMESVLKEIRAAEEKGEDIFNLKMSEFETDIEIYYHSVEFERLKAQLNKKI